MDSFLAAKIRWGRGGLLGDFQKEFFLMKNVECIMHNERAGCFFRQKDIKTGFFRCRGASLKLDA